jgi:hypothetical protein
LEGRHVANADRIIGTLRYNFFAEKAKKKDFRFNRCLLQITDTVLQLDAFSKTITTT